MLQTLSTYKYVNLRICELDNSKSQTGLDQQRRGFNYFKCVNLHTCAYGGYGGGGAALFAGFLRRHGGDGDVNVSVVLITHHHVHQRCT